MQKKQELWQGRPWSKAKPPSGAVCWLQGLTNTPLPTRLGCRPAVEGIPDPCPSGSGAPWLKEGCRELAGHRPSPSPGAKSRGELSQPPAEPGFEGS